jgi:hypothetical protein
LESMADMPCGVQHLGHQVGLAAVVIEYGDSHDRLFLKR